MNARLPLAYVVLIAALLAASFWIPRSAVFVPGAVIAAPGEATLQLYDGLIKLITGLNTALLAAAAAVAVKGPDWTPRWRLLDSAAILLVFVGAAASYYGVYLCYVRLLSMVPEGFVNPLERQMAWALRLAYWGVIGGVALLGLVFTRILASRHAAPAPAATGAGPAEAPLAS